MLEGNVCLFNFYHIVFIQKLNLFLNTHKSKSNYNVLFQWIHVLKSHVTNE